MKVDIKEKLKEEKVLRELSNNHRSIFEKKLQKELHRSSGSIRMYLMVAASVIILFGAGYLFTLTEVDLELTDGNKLILQEYFRKMNSLTNEYKLQSEQLEIDKIDEELINNLIDNLQMRLQLMIELKKELKKLKSKENETNTL